MNDIREIVERLGLTGEAEAALHVALLRELAQGQPVTIERLAKSLSWAKGQVVLVLEKLPGGTIEYDCEGRLIGYGITLRETPHAFVVNDQPLYTWCALDAQPQTFQAIRSLTHRSDGTDGQIAGYERQSAR